MSGRRALGLAVASVVALILANAGLAAWLAIALARGPAGPDIVSVWRKGALVERQVPAAVGDPKTAFASQLATPGTTVVVEHIVGEGRVLKLSRSLFSQSFLAGRDGVRATLNGKDAYLTPHDLVNAGLYRGTAPGRWVGPVGGLDEEGVLDRLSQELGCSKDTLWSEAGFRRFIVTRTVTANLPEETDPVRQARLDKTPTGARLTIAAEDAGKLMTARVDIKGRFADLLWAPTYDWSAHVQATRFLAEAGSHFESHFMRGAARRAAYLVLNTATQRCGLDACVGIGDRIDIGPSAEMLIAYSDLARERAGVPFREPTAQVAAFLRAQQRWDGGFSAYYDRAHQRAIRDERPDLSALAVLALAHAHKVTKNAEDLDAAERGLDYLISNPGLLGVRDYLNASYRICDAVDDLWQRDQNPAGLSFCEKWTRWGALLQLDGTISEYGGGYRNGAGWMPEVVATATRTEGAAATVGAALLAGRNPNSLTELDLSVTRGLEFLLRQQLPGTYPYARADAENNLGAFPRGPGDRSARSDVTAAAGSALLRCLKVLETRGLPPPRKARRQAARIIEDDDGNGNNLPINRGGTVRRP